jgi:hypothetical protein
MRRREFISLLGGAAAGWPFAARGQQSKVARIGVFYIGLEDAESFKKELRVVRLMTLGPPGSSPRVLASESARSAHVEHVSPESNAKSTPRISQPVPAQSSFFISSRILSAKLDMTLCCSALRERAFCDSCATDRPDMPTIKKVKSAAHS